MQVYTFDFICDSQDFNHDEEFVLKEDLDSEMESKQKEIQSLKKMIVEARIRLEHIAKYAPIGIANANRINEFLEQTKDIKVD